MKLVSRKIMAWIVNTILLTALLIYLKQTLNNLPVEIINYIIFAQVVLNTGFLLVSNFMDKQLWTTHNIKNGKEKMENEVN